MATLERVEIKGFKSIRQADIELNPLNILIGANGAGKSNFIQTFYLLHEIINERLQLFVGRSGGANLMLYQGRKVTSQIRFRFSFGSNAYRVDLEATADDRLFFAQEMVGFRSQEYINPYIQELGSGHQESRLNEISQSTTRRTIADDVLWGINSWRIYQFHDTSDSAKMKQTGDIHDNEFFRPDASNLAAFLYLLQESHPRHYLQVINTIRLVAPFFDTFYLRPSPLNPEKIRLEWREINSDMIFPASTLSDGTLRFMCLATLFLQPEPPSLILVDEPELGLHPYAISLLASLLRQAATRTQVIISTQSVPLVNQFTPQDIIVVDRIDGESQFRRLEDNEIAQWLDDYGMGDLWEKNVIGGRP